MKVGNKWREFCAKIVVVGGGGVVGLEVGASVEREKFANLKFPEVVKGF